MSKIIPGENLVECTPLVLQEVGRTGAGGRVGRGGMLTAQQLEAIQKQAYEEGFALGRKEGHAAARSDIQAQVQRLDQLMRTLARPFEDLDQQVELELVTLAMAVARQLVRRELKADPAQVIGVVREALSALPAASRNVRVHLHPEDAALVRETLSLREGDQAWTIAEDPMQGRGGCRVVSDLSQVDAGLESRLTAVITAVLGGQRGTDSAADT